MILQEDPFGKCAVEREKKHMNEKLAKKREKLMAQATETVKATGADIVWSGMAEYYSPFEGEMKKGTLLRMILGLGIAVVIDIIYAAMELASDQPQIKPFLLILVLVIGAVVAFMPLVDRFEVTRTAAYFLTKDTAIAVVEGSPMAVIPLKNTPVKSVPSAFGNVNVLFGDAVTAKPRTYAHLGFAPAKGDEGSTDIVSMVFFNVPKSAALKEALKEVYV